MYCDFYSIENRSSMEVFLRALHKEIDLSVKYAGDGAIETIFFGGGTPSLLSPRQLESIMTRLRNTFSVQRDAEITLETNPGTVDLEKLAAYRSLGVNRLSIGIQSFHDDELLFLGRIHTGAQAFDCVKSARMAGFDNISFDFIFSLPGQTLASWEENLRTALSLSPEHLSAYSLIVEDHTPLERLVRLKQVSLNPPELEAVMYEFTMEYMAGHGFEQYEVSNYAMEGYRSRHNYNYWSHKNYIGFGPSAHSFRNLGSTAHRWWNIAQLSTYCSRLDENLLPRASHEVVGREDLVTERLFLGLRSDGVDIQKIRKDLGFTLLDEQREIARQLVTEGMATFEGGSLRLTSRGYLLCDEICRRLV
jgi:oxygen-independent coproporphyrinogen III oxidase